MLVKLKYYLILMFALVFCQELDILTILFVIPAGLAYQPCFLPIVSERFLLKNSLLCQGMKEQH